MKSRGNSTVFKVLGISVPKLNYQQQFSYDPLKPQCFTEVYIYVYNIYTSNYVHHNWWTMHFINFFFLILSEILQSNKQGNFANMSCTWKSLQNIWDHKTQRLSPSLQGLRLGDIITDCNGEEDFCVTESYFVSTQEFQCWARSQLCLGSASYVATDIFSRNVH